MEIQGTLYWVANKAIVCGVYTVFPRSLNIWGPGLSLAFPWPCQPEVTWDWKLILKLLVNENLGARNGLLRISRVVTSFIDGSSGRRECHTILFTLRRPHAGRRESGCSVNKLYAVFFYYVPISIYESSLSWRRLQCLKASALYKIGGMQRLSPLCSLGHKALWAPRLGGHSSTPGAQGKADG